MTYLIKWHRFVLKNQGKNIWYKYKIGLNIFIIKLLIIIFTFSLFLHGRDTDARNIYVNKDSGSNEFNGLSEGIIEGNKGPFKTFNRAIAEAEPGDTIIIIPSATPYNVSLAIKNKCGEEEKPIIVDGNMNIISGLQPINIQEWTKEGPGLYQKSLSLKPNSELRYFLVFDRKINRMNRSVKGKNAPFKTPEELQPGEWTYLADQKKLYVKIDENSSLENAKIEEPLLPSSIGIEAGGVFLSGAQHIIIRNLIVEYWWNDGFSLYGNNKNIRFENIAARFNGDDGISIHQNGQIEVENFIAIGNGSGIAHTGSSVSTNKNIYISQNSGIDIYLRGETHILNNVIVEKSFSPHTIIDCKKIEMKRCYFNNLNPQPGTIQIEGDQFNMDESFIWGFNIRVNNSSAVVTKSTIGGPQKISLQVTPLAQWTADYNRYLISQIKMGTTIYHPGIFEQYRNDLKQDLNSVFMTTSDAIEPPLFIEQLYEDLRNVFPAMQKIMDKDIHKDLLKK